MPRSIRRENKGTRKQKDEKAEGREKQMAGSSREAKPWMGRATNFCFVPIVCCWVDGRDWFREAEQGAYLRDARLCNGCQLFYFPGLGTGSVWENKKLTFFSLALFHKIAF